MARTPGGTLSAFTLLSTPDAPTITGVTTSIGSASVAFTPPSDDGDGAITSYVVTAVDESSGVSTGGTGTSSPITVSPPAGGTFKIRMQALNPYGPGRLTEYDTGNAIYSGAELYAWGEPAGGALGTNNAIKRSSPVQVGSLTTWASVSMSTFSLGVTTAGTLFAWGFNTNGNLGLNNRVNVSSPVQVGALTNWSQVSAGGNHGPVTLTSAAVKTDGTLWAWGSNGNGEVGDSTVYTRSSPVQIGLLTNWASVSTGSQMSIAVTNLGSIYSWGSNAYGQLGLNLAGSNPASNRSSPVQIGSLTNWQSVSVGREFVLAVKTDNTLWAWGSNSSGRLGNGSGPNCSSPIQVGASTDWSKASNGWGSLHSVAVKTNGTLWSWGTNTYGVLGINNVAARSSPTQIGSLTTWLGPSAARDHSMATKSDGTLWAWGRNSSGEVGDNTIVARSSPVQVGALTNWTSATAGAYRTLALYGVV